MIFSTLSECLSYNNRLIRGNFRTQNTREATIAYTLTHFFLRQLVRDDQPLLMKDVFLTIQKLVFNDAFFKKVFEFSIGFVEYNFENGPIFNNEKEVITKHCKTTLERNYSTIKNRQIINFFSKQQQVKIIEPSQLSAYFAIVIYELRHEVPLHKIAAVSNDIERFENK